MDVVSEVDPDVVSDVMSVVEPVGSVSSVGEPPIGSLLAVGSTPTPGVVPGVIGDTAFGDTAFGDTGDEGAPDVGPTAALDIGLLPPGVVPLGETVAAASSGVNDPSPAQARSDRLQATNIVVSLIMRAFMREVFVGIECGRLGEARRGEARLYATRTARPCSLRMG